MTVALLDADIICYQAAAVAEQDIDWGDGDGVYTHLDIQKACGVADDIVDEWYTAAKGKRKLLIFGGTSDKHPSFRVALYPEYKAHRKTAKKPKLYKDVQKYLKDNYKSMSVRGLEGDDVLGLLATGPQGKKYTVVSIDKDMRTLPVRLVNPNPRAARSATPPKGGKPALVRISTAQADHFWMQQTLIGDSADNYPGCPGIGEKKAADILPMATHLNDMWAAVLRAFNDQYDKPRWREKFCDTPQRMAFTMARLSRILRDGDYKTDGNKVGQVRLWIPDTGATIWHTIT